MFSFAQEKVKEIKLDKNESLNFLKVADDGTILLKTNKEVYAVVYRSYKDNKLTSLDKNLDKKFEIEVANTFPKGFLELSKNLEYTINADQLINKEGQIKEYPFGKKNTYSRIDKKSGLNPVFHFFNDYAWTVIGPKNGRFNLKKKYSKNDVFIYNLRNEDVKEETYVLKTTEIETNRKSVSWLLSEHNTKNSFYLFSRDKLKNKEHVNNLHIVENNYKGEIVSYSKITTNLGEDKFFITSNEMNYSIDFNRFSINEDNNTILVYGYYSNNKGSFYDVKHTKPSKQVAKVDGFYVFKYKKGGKLLWKNFISFEKMPKTNFQTRGLMFSEFKNKGILECHLGNISGFFKIDLNTGENQSNSSSLTSFFEKKILKNKYFLKINLLSGLQFSHHFKDKKTNKNGINAKVLSAMILKPEIKDFMLDRASKKKGVTYNAKFSKENIYITEITKAGRGVKEKTLTIFKF